MSKKVLILTSKSEKTVAWKERQQYIRDFCEQTESLLPDTEIYFATYADLTYSIHNGQTAIHDNLNGCDVTSYSFVHFKNWQYETEEAPVIARYLAANHVPFFNSEVSLYVGDGKLAQMFVLATAKIPVPDTFYTQKANLKSLFKNKNKLPAYLTYPLIMKANDGSKGDDNHLLRDAKDALEVLKASAPDKNYVLQNFIPNEGDYRFLFVGLDSEPIIFHRQAAKGSHLNNTSKGGTGNFIDAGQLPTRYTDYARTAAELLQKEIGGVDILVNSRTQQPYILEVNGTPALATGYGVGAKAKKFAAFLKKQLDAEEEE